MCDTFVALANATKDNSVIFGKNSDRPQLEAQLITYIPSSKHNKDEKVKCTYISIPQVPETYASILSQPYWMYGAEMAVNCYGVAIGNEAVYTKEILRERGLLGMDLLRLGVERGKTAKEALNIIIDLLEEYGQGGSCSYGEKGWLYHNSYIIADPKEAYVLETADKWWIVEIVKDIRSISNNLSIRGKGDIKRDGIIQHAIEHDYCKDDNDFDFAMIFSNPEIPNVFPPNSRGGCSLKLLNSNKGSITPSMMMKFLREHEVGICMHGSFQSTGSQVSHLREHGKSIHWFTGGTLPCLNIYKPYIFPSDQQIFSTINPGPYIELDGNWFWSRHKEFINPYKKCSINPEKQSYMDNLRKMEREILTDVNKLLEQEDKFTEDQFMNQIVWINKKVWGYSEKMIK